jgi:hypothetical protein
MVNRYTLAGLLAVLATAGLVGLGVLAANGGSDEPSRPDDRAADTSAPAPAGAEATPPPVRIKNLAQAAKAAGCTLKREPDEGAAHVDRPVTAADYGTNPPTSGLHAPTWADDGVYDSGTTPELGLLVHTLEHGRINVQYRPDTDAKSIAQLKALYQEMDKGHHVLLYANATDMPFAVAATAWDHLLGCPRMNPKVFDAIRAFTATFVDQGPETVP